MRSSPPKQRTSGWLEIDLAIGLAILTLAILPLGYSFAQERRALRASYHRAVVMELVDGEMEILAAGAGKDLPDGVRDHPVHSLAAAGLPAGRFELTKTGNRLRLEWRPEKKCGVSRVAREAVLK